MEYYTVLGLDPHNKTNITLDDIKKAFRRQAQRYHPDKGGTVIQYQQIMESYDVLSNPEHRHLYDIGNLTNYVYNVNLGPTAHELMVEA